jgi:hypothetical protein
MNLTFSDAKITMDGGCWLCLKVNEPAPARAFVYGIQNRLYDCILKEHREKRSLDANAYLWVLLDKLAEETRVPKTEIYRKAIKEIGGVSDTICVQQKAVERLISGWSANGLGWFAETLESKIGGCVNVILYYGSSVYDTKEMSRLIDYVVEDCKALGIETLPPDKLEAMKESWKCTE